MSCTRYIVSSDPDSIAVFSQKEKFALFDTRISVIEQTVDNIALHKGSKNAKLCCTRCNLDPGPDHCTCWDAHSDDSSLIWSRDMKNELL